MPRSCQEGRRHASAAGSTSQSAWTPGRRCTARDARSRRARDSADEAVAPFRVHNKCVLDLARYIAFEKPRQAWARSKFIHVVGRPSAGCTATAADGSRCARHRRVDEQPDPAGIDTRLGQRLDPRHRSGVGEADVFGPPPRASLLIVRRSGRAASRAGGRYAAHTSTARRSARRRCRSASVTRREVIRRSCWGSQGRVVRSAMAAITPAATVR